MRRVSILPTLVTAANGFCGLLAIYKTQDGKVHAAAFMIMLAMVFDVLDGLVARKAGITSRFGAYLDSLSDAVSFGVAPAFLVKVVVEGSGITLYNPKVLTGFTAIFTICALFRLARYNVEHTPSEGRRADGRAVATFAGMPTPGAAGVLASLVYLYADPKRLFDLQPVCYVLPALCPILGYLMVSRVPYIHAGTRFLRVRRDLAYLVVVVVVIIAGVFFTEEVAAIAFVGYLLSGAIMFVRRRLRGEPPDESPEEMATETPHDDLPEGL
ncbi:MAG TPA: CDP-diacylglycerol--serine O-phosphatidyltransferase [Planctomycetota bacterium]|nr:CDP-diacylglycerol--serine O-phosphatidyltransferase [Planctomycetota bacterium]